MTTSFDAGRVVVVDRRGGALPPEPGKARPAVVVGDSELLGGYLGVLVVPLTTAQHLAHAHFSVQIDPTEENSLRAVSWALSHHVTMVSVQRIQPSAGAVDPEQLHQIRERIALAVGLPGDGPA